jgi:phosphoserine phosphatase
VARGPEKSAPVLVGLVSLYDPPRPDAKQLIATLHDLGVPVKMLTGDALPVALEIGQGVGLPNIKRMADLKTASAQAENKTVDLFAGADGFAEVFPEDKYTVVKHLQAAGHVSGMTGDGVNDAPALRQAEVGIAVSTATDVAKGAASVVLTEAGLTNIVALVEQGRTIYQRILTWVINKISRTILKAAFVAIAFVVTGKFVVSAFAMLLLVFMTDFAKISLATDNVRPSKNPETWNIGGFIVVSVVLGIAMVAETLFLLWIGWTRFGLATNDNALYTFSFLMLLYFAVFSVVSARERSWFWATLPSKTFMSALAADAIAGTVLTFVGLKGLMPLPWWQTLAVFGYAMVSCLVLNDAVKVAMIKWRVPNPMAVKAVDASPQIAKAEPKPAAKNELQPGAKAETKPEAKPVPPPENKGEPAPEAKGAPQPDAKAAPAAETKAEPQPEAKATPQPDATAAPVAEAKAGPEPDDNIDVAKLMNTTLGDVLLAGVLKDPQGAGRIIAEAITHAETPIAAAKTPEGKVGPKSETAAETKDETKAKAPANLTSKIAK